ncbi:helix-hairpin-helix domain-containing protein [Weissella viridescens]|uniref:helix-hairpin-helix domain-containing protein n=2 Tax=Weissella viridescens TaxID=1629 RepID=UPI0035276131
MEAIIRQLHDYYKKYSLLKYLFIIIVMGMGMGYLLVQHHVKTQPEIQKPLPVAQPLKDDSQESKRENVKVNTLRVDIKGHVKAPNVYTFNQNELVQDAIKRAGGLTPHGDTRNVNLAQKLTDGLMLYIPKKGETVTNAFPGHEGVSENAKAKLDINQVSVTELQEIPGIGPKRAADIISFRETNGPFKSIDDLTQVSGFGPKTLQKIRTYFLS